MKIITCAGYYRTGSSAVTDFYSEFQSCESFGKYEFRFLQDPDGVSALETNIVEHPHRHNTSHAIKRFLKYSRFENGNFISKRYRKYFHDNYWKYTLQYINELTKVKCDALWRYDKIERGRLFYFIDSVVAKISEKLNHGKKFSLLKLVHEKGYYTDISKEEFYRITKKYTGNLFKSWNTRCDYLIVDQLVAPSEPERYLNYVDDMYIVIVDRDPRDVFILESEAEWGVIPYKNVEEFCEWYRVTRSHRKHEIYTSGRVMFLRFEDMVYRYEETAKALMSFVGLEASQHINNRKKFDPEKSIKGTNLINAYPQYREQVSYIEEHLKDYLFDFSEFNIVNTEKLTQWNE